MPLFDPKLFPFLISRSKFKIDLVDIEEHRIYTLCAESNTTGLTPKLVVNTQRKEGGHCIDIYFTGQVADKRATKCLSIEPSIVKKMFKEPDRDYFRYSTN